MKAYDPELTINNKQNTACNMQLNEIICFDFFLHLTQIPSHFFFIFFSRIVWSFGCDEKNDRIEM